MSFVFSCFRAREGACGEGKRGIYHTSRSISRSRSFSCSEYPARSPQSERETPPPSLPPALPSRFPMYMRWANIYWKARQVAMAKAERERERRRRGGSCAALCPPHGKKEVHYVLRRGGIKKLDRRTAQTKPRGISFLLLPSAVRTVCVRGDLRYAVSVAVRSAALSANFLPYLTSELASPCDLT